MAQLVFNLKNVPADEANDIRELLELNQIEFYETSAGRWNISVAAIWINNDDDFVKSRQLINQYQYNLAIRRQQEKSDPESRVHIPDWKEHLLNNPVVFLMYISAIAIVLALSILPFFRLSSLLN